MESAGVMLGDALIKSLTRKADIIGVVAAAEHIDEDIHGFSPFDRLRVRRGIDEDIHRFAPFDKLALRQAQGEEGVSPAHCASASRLRS
jgi:hypothetical protein